MQDVNLINFFVGCLNNLLNKIEVMLTLFFELKFHILEIAYFFNNLLTRDIRQA